MRLPLLIALTTTMTMAADAAKDDEAKKDLEKFQGRWALVSLELNGKKTPDEDVMKMKLTVQGNRFVLEKDNVVISKGTLKLDPTKKPKELDETMTAGTSKGKTYPAIYEIDNDRHTICFSAPGKKRPSEFSSTPGSGHLLQVWERKK